MSEHPIRAARRLDAPLLRPLVPAIALALAGALAVGCAEPPATVGPGDRLAPLDLGQVLGGPAEAGFARALGRPTLTFPADHGPHPAFRSEWWYFTGNLVTTADDPEPGRPFGFQLTFFRTSLAPPSATPPRTSAWASAEVWMAHLALADPDGGRFVSCERFARGALGLAGARPEPFAVWLAGWRAAVPNDAAAGTAGGPSVALVPGFPRVHLAAAVDATTPCGGALATSPTSTATATPFALALDVVPAKPLVLQGDGGLSQKGPEPGNASIYTSLTRLATRGEVRLGDRTFRVAGSAWLDREWSTSALSEGEVGWDWFALQLDDGHELMLYQLRRRDGSVSPFSSGTLVDAWPADGGAPATSDTPGDPPFPVAASRHLAADAFRILPRGTWSSPRGGSYPAGWTIEVPSAGLRLDVTPRLADQELDATVRYWEGAVTAAGSHQGIGYVELTGYAEGRSTTR